MGKSGNVHPEGRLLRVFRRTNVRDGERWLSVLAGLAVLALARRRWLARAMALTAGGLLLRRGLTGTCPIYRKLGLTSR
jgi:hypothetical protein